MFFPKTCYLNAVISLTYDMKTGTGNPKMNKTSALTLSHFQPRRGDVIYNKQSDIRQCWYKRNTQSGCRLEEGTLWAVLLPTVGKDCIADSDLPGHP